MPSIMIVAQNGDSAKRLQSELSGWGFTFLVAGVRERVIDRIIKEAPELVIVEMDGAVSQTVLRELKTGTRVKRTMPVIAVLSSESLDQSGDYLSADDFIVQPYDKRELAARARRLLQRTAGDDEVIRAGDLEIDLAKCEVRVEGKIVELTFKEFELLKFLVKDRGRVFSRETLLNKVWGYDYFGGDRTVDVHVRRLRSKIELTGRTFIETVRNIGYRFSKK